MLYLLLLDTLFVEGHGGLLLFGFIITLFASDYRLFHAVIAIPALYDFLYGIHVSIFEHDEELLQYLRHESSDF